MADRGIHPWPAMGTTPRASRHPTAHDQLKLRGIESRTGPSGPFTSSTAASAASVVIGVQRALRFGKLQSIGLTGTHPIHVSALSGPGISPLSGQLGT